MINNNYYTVRLFLYNNNLLKEGNQLKLAFISDIKVHPKEVIDSL